MSPPARRPRRSPALSSANLSWYVGVSNLSWYALPVRSNPCRTSQGREGRARERETSSQSAPRSRSAKYFVRGQALRGCIPLSTALRFSVKPWACPNTRQHPRWPIPTSRRYRSASLLSQSRKGSGRNEAPHPRKSLWPVKKGCRASTTYEEHCTRDRPAGATATARVFIGCRSQLPLPFDRE